MFSPLWRGDKVVLDPRKESFPEHRRDAMLRENVIAPSHLGVWSKKKQGHGEVIP